MLSSYSIFNTHIRPQPFAHLSFGSRTAMRNPHLFPNGTDFLKFKQGNLPDCQFLAPLLALSMNSASANTIGNWVQNTSKNAYEVCFPAYPDRPVMVTERELRRYFRKEAKRVKDQKPRQNPRYTHSRDKGVLILEAAYPKLYQGLFPERFEEVSEAHRIYEHPAYLVSPGQALSDLTGRRFERVFNSVYLPYGKASLQALQKLADEPERYIVVASTKAPFTPESPLDKSGKLKGNHAYAIEHIDPNAEEILMRDPHHSQRSIPVSYAEYFQFFDKLEYVDLNESCQPQPKPMLPRGLSDYPIYG